MQMPANSDQLLDNTDQKSFVLDKRELYDR